MFGKTSDGSNHFGMRAALAARRGEPAGAARADADATFGALFDALEASLDASSPAHPAFPDARASALGSFRSLWEPRLASLASDADALRVASLRADADAFASRLAAFETRRAALLAASDAERELASRRVSAAVDALTMRADAIVGRADAACRAAAESAAADAFAAAAANEARIADLDSAHAWGRFFERLAEDVPFATPGRLAIEPADDRARDAVARLLRALPDAARLGVENDDARASDEGIGETHSPSSARRRRSVAGYQYLSSPRARSVSARTMPRRCLAPARVFRVFRDPGALGSAPEAAVRAFLAASDPSGETVAVTEETKPSSSFRSVSPGKLRAKCVASRRGRDGNDADASASRGGWSACAYPLDAPGTVGDLVAALRRGVTLSDPPSEAPASRSLRRPRSHGSRVEATKRPPDRTPAKASRGRGRGLDSPGFIVKAVRKPFSTKDAFSLPPGVSPDAFVASAPIASVAGSNRVHDARLKPWVYAVVFAAGERDPPQGALARPATVRDLVLAAAGAFENDARFKTKLCVRREEEEEDEEVQGGMVIPSGEGEDPAFDDSSSRARSKRGARFLALEPAEVDALIEAYLGLGTSGVFSNAGDASEGAVLDLWPPATRRRGGVQPGDHVAVVYHEPSAVPSEEEGTDGPSSRALPAFVAVCRLEPTEEPGPSSSASARARPRSAPGGTAHRLSPLASLADDSGDRAVVAALDAGALAAGVARLVAEAAREAAGAGAEAAARFPAGVTTDGAAIAPRGWGAREWDLDELAAALERAEDRLRDARGGGR